MQYIVRLLGENKSNSFLLFSVCCGSTGGKKKKPPQPSTFTFMANRHK